MPLRCFECTRSAFLLRRHGLLRRTSGPSLITYKTMGEQSCICNANAYTYASAANFALSFRATASMKGTVLRYWSGVTPRPWTRIAKSFVISLRDPTHVPPRHVKPYFASRPSPRDGPSDSSSVGGKMKLPKRIDSKRKRWQTNHFLIIYSWKFHNTTYPPSTVSTTDASSWSAKLIKGRLLSSLPRCRKPPLHA